MKTNWREVAKEFEAGFKHSCELCSLRSCSEHEDRLEHVGKRMAEEILRLREAFDNFRTTTCGCLPLSGEKNERT